MSSTFHLITSTPTQRSRTRTLRFADIYSSQHATYNPEAPYSPGDPFIAFEKIKDIKVNGNISKAPEKAFDKERVVIANPNLPQKPCNPASKHIPPVRKNDNRIFVRLPETHASRGHHIHTVKAALHSKLGPEGDYVRSIQKVKSGIAIVPVDEKRAEKLLEKSHTITSILGGKVEKTEEWVTYVIDHVPRKIHSLDGKEIEITEGSVKEEAEAVTGQIPIRGTWSRKTLANSAPTGTIVASFKKHTHAFRLFGTSSLARKVIKFPKPTQCPKCWGLHDARLCNYEQRCKKCSVTGHSSCKNPPRCTHCRGPHFADQIHCLARPIVRNGIIVPLSETQMKKVRHAGHKACLLANPANPEANVAREQTNHDLALALARDESVDIIILQKPWIFPDLEKKSTKTHADFDTFSPTDDWEERPRVITYIRKGRGLQAVQIRPSNTTDICWVTIMGFTPPITIANVYRPPQETEGGAVISALKAFHVPSNYLVAGGFNTRQPLWDSRETASSKSVELVDWVQTNDLVLASPIDKISGSGFKPHSPRAQFSLKPENIPHIAAVVKETLPTVDHLPHDVDILSNLITQSIQMQSRQGTKWWNKECTNKAAEYRRARRQGDATVEKYALRKATRAAKKGFWMKKVEEVRQPKEIFKITSWHKYNGTFGPPPLKHDESTFMDFSGKASALRRALLERKTSDENISLELEPTVCKDELHEEVLVELDEIDRQQFGALPKRSAADLVGCLVHDIEKARSQRKVASLLTMDIRGAFDTVLPGRLKYRLRKQGWPKWLIGRVESFVTNRSARIRMGDFFTQETPLTCGLPLGSPVSPILFMLYIEPLISLANPRYVFSYADDIAFHRIGKTLSVCSEKLALDLEKVTEWGIGNAIIFDQDKTELQHSTQAPKPKEYPNIRLCDWCIVPNQWAAKASKVAMHLKRLNNILRGSRPDLVRQAVKSCVLSIATYGAEVWWARRNSVLMEQRNTEGPKIQKALGKASTRLTRTTKLLPLSVDGKDFSLCEKKLKFDSNVPRKNHDVHLYTDGSRSLDGKAEGGFVIFQAGRKVKTGSFGIDRKVESIDTEIIAICQGLNACTT
ncbi:hypothetical protein EPUL_003848 [Erysiphe pulchra]|uniref:Reverse transcriptase domain-containing protein n=1 Tax=Erysiphe pulchra TaxID=225359 RepID=A0A2S4PLI7_9PEZI|nr:hypothetical protein EPUL_003848 [Erysiphe pulchra]